jgi:hypothetical protein
LTGEKRFIDVFNTGRAPAEWFAKASQDWIKLSQTTGNLSNDTRIWVSFDRDRAPTGTIGFETIKITGAGATRIVNVLSVGQPLVRLLPAPGFVESDGVVAIEAEHFTSKQDRAGAGWQIIPGLGRSGNAMAVFPTIAPSIDLGSIVEKSPLLEYGTSLFSTSNVTVTCYLAPTHPVKYGKGLRYAVGFDNEEPHVVTIDTDVQSRNWSHNVLNSSATGVTTHVIAGDGPHVLKIYMIDPGVVLDKIVLDAGGLRPSYLGPEETRIVGSPENKGPGN